MPTADSTYRTPVARDRRRRVRGRRGTALLRQRCERLERPNAHLYETGGMRRTHLRGHTNILKRLLIHVGGGNLGPTSYRGIGPVRSVPPSYKRR